MKYTHGDVWDCEHNDRIVVLRGGENAHYIGKKFYTTAGAKALAGIDEPHRYVRVEDCKPLKFVCNVFVPEGHWRDVFGIVHKEATNESG